MNTRIYTLTLATSLACSSFLCASAQTWETIPQFPDPAPDSYTVVGTGLADGRFVLWNGDRIFVQGAVGSGLFAPVAQGYLGDPAFAALSPDGQTLVLGGGYTPRLYKVSVNAWQDYSAASELDVPTHYTGVFLSNALVALDRGKDDFSGAEIVVVDIAGSKSASQPRSVLSTPSIKAQVIDKPPFAYSAQIAVNDSLTTLYVMDANTRELRGFSVADLIDAYINWTPLDWNTDGVLIGAPGDYYNGGPAGALSDGHLAIGGAAGFGGPGGIQIVNPATGAVVVTHDPTGTQQYVSVIFNPTLDSMIALDGFLFDAYATTGSIGNLPTFDGAGLAILVIALGLLCIRRVAVTRL